MNAEMFSEAMGELDLRYVEEAMSFKGRTARRGWLKLAVCAACLVLVVTAAVFAYGRFAPWRGENVIELSEHSVNVRARYTDKAPAVSSSYCLVYFTEEELFRHFDTAIFRGTVREIRNIELDFNGDSAYRAIAEIDVSDVWRGPCAEGETVSVLLPCPIDAGVWVSGTGVVSQMREGMEGIFMPIIYDEENSRWEQNGAVLIQKDLVDYGFADGVRFAFLETDEGLVFDRGSYESFADAQTLDEVWDEIMWRTGLVMAFNRQDEQPEA